VDFGPLEQSHGLRRPPKPPAQTLDARKLACAAQFECSEILVPVAVRHVGILQFPFGQFEQVPFGDLPLSCPFAQKGPLLRVVTRPYREARRATRVLEFSAGVSSVPLLRNAEESEQLKDGGTRVEVRLTAPPFSEKGLLGSQKRVGKGTLNDLVAWLCPATNISVTVEQASLAERVIAAEDWKTLPPDKLLVRCNPDAAADQAQRLKGRVLDIISGQSEPIPRVIARQSETRSQVFYLNSMHRNTRKGKGRIFRPRRQTCQTRTVRLAANLYVFFAGFAGPLASLRETTLPVPLAAVDQAAFSSNPKFGLAPTNPSPRRQAYQEGHPTVRRIGPPWKPEAQ